MDELGVDGDMGPGLADVLDPTEPVTRATTLPGRRTTIWPPPKIARTLQRRTLRRELGIAQVEHAAAVPAFDLAAAERLRACCGTRADRRSPRA
jgi:hypothetical protein